MDINQFKKLVVFLIILFFSTAAKSQTCGFHPVSFQIEKGDYLVWQGNNFIITPLGNADVNTQNKSDTVYYADKIRVQSLKSKKECLIDGISAEKDSIYVNQNENILAFHHGFALLGAFETYDLNTCKKLSETDGWLAKIKDEKVYLSGGCEAVSITENIAHCCPAEVYQLDPKCNLQVLPKESSDFTLEFYGVAISKCETLKDQGTKNVRILKTTGMK